MTPILDPLLGSTFKPQTAVNVILAICPPKRGSKMGSFGASKWAYFGPGSEQYLGSFIIAQAGFGHIPPREGLKKGVQNRGLGPLFWTPFWRGIWAEITLTPVWGSNVT